MDAPSFHYRRMAMSEKLASVSGVPEPWRTQIEDAFNKTIQEDPDIMEAINKAMDKAFRDDLNLMLYGTTHPHIHRENDYL